MDKRIAKPGETRSLATDIAQIATPVAVVAAPIVNAWAKEHVGSGGKSSGQEPPKAPKS